MLDAWLSAPCPDRSVPDASRPVLCADRSVFSTLALCPERRLLRARHLTVRSEPGLLRALDLPPCTERGYRRAQYLAPLAVPVVLRASTLGAAPFANYFALDTCC